MLAFHYQRSSSWRFLLASACALSLIQYSAAVVLAADDGRAEGKVDFSRDIRPILADTCFKCHGPDEHDRQAGLRLDTQAGVFDDSGSVVPRDLDASELYQRIISDDEDTLMPPPDSGRTLTDEQRNLVKRWIEQGANWENHWSLVAPRKPSLPNLIDAVAVTPVDNFIIARLQQEGIQAGPPADRHDLIRRVSFDLTGLPPSPERLRKYIADSSSNWYESLVDELLASDHYGEHMARFWLDASRYGDTHGLHLDNYREMWPYRDWVVKAFLENKSYRDFTIEQLAGDLLEDPTDEQKIASGFNRAHITTSEGGAIEEEVYVRNVVDRVATTGTVFLGMTVGCAQCHDHKFDPISQKEFYQLFAYFNNLSNNPLDGNQKDPAPVLKVLSDEQRAELARLKTAAQVAAQEFSQRVSQYVYEDPADLEADAESTGEAAADQPQEYIWIDDESLPLGAKAEQKWEFVSGDQIPVQAGFVSRVATADDRMVQHFFTGASEPLKAKSGDKLFAYVFLDPQNPPSEVMLQFNDGDWNHRVFWGADRIGFGETGTPSRYRAGDLPATGEWVRLEVDAATVGFGDPSLINGMAFSQWGGKVYWDSAGIVSTTEQAPKFDSLKKWLIASRKIAGKGLPAEIAALVKQEPDKLDEPAQAKLREYFLTAVYAESVAELRTVLQERNESRKVLETFDKSLPTTLISEERPEPKPAFVLKRGEYDQHGEEVVRATPAALPPMDESLPNNRLGFAKWLTSGYHPLTARVAVNRFWQQVFGTGLVKTSEDFGAQGDVPSHPELLDWLATDFVEHDWDVKRLMKMLVMSATYRQSSAVSPELLARDPENRLLGRGPRFRLDAEMLRDQALAVSGLLEPTLGGPSVKPPQPDGLWFAVGYSGSNTVRFQKDSGPEKVHRRSLYTFWKRTAPPPQMNTFDAPSREECSVRRERTNTPLQALLMMNDPQYVEAARYLAEQIVELNAASGGSGELASDAEAIDWLFQRALARPVTARELKLIQTTLEEHRADFKAEAETANKLTAIGETKPAKEADKVELASWTMIVSLVMNMDEFLTKN